MQIGRSGHKSDDKWKKFTWIKLLVSACATPYGHVHFEMLPVILVQSLLVHYTFYTLKEYVLPLTKLHSINTLLKHSFSMESL